MADARFAIPEDAVGVRLYRHKGNDLIGYEPTMFVNGNSAVDTLLRRAAISGHVEIEGKIRDHFLDLLDAEGSIVGTVALDASSFRSIKTRWARTKMETYR